MNKEQVLSVIKQDSAEYEDVFLAMDSIAPIFFTDILSFTCFDQLKTWYWLGWLDLAAQHQLATKHQVTSLSCLTLAQSLEISTKEVPTQFVDPYQLFDFNLNLTANECESLAPYAYLFIKLEQVKGNSTLSPDQFRDYELGLHFLRAVQKAKSEQQAWRLLKVIAREDEAPKEEPYFEPNPIHTQMTVPEKKSTEVKNTLVPAREYGKRLDAILEIVIKRDKTELQQYVVSFGDKWLNRAKKSQYWFSFKDAFESLDPCKILRKREQINKEILASHVAWLEKQEARIVEYEGSFPWLDRVALYRHQLITLNASSDHFEVLNLSREYHTLEEVTENFKEAAQMYHPDYYTRYFNQIPLLFQALQKRDGEIMPLIMRARKALKTQAAIDEYCQNELGKTVTPPLIQG